MPHGVAAFLPFSETSLQLMTPQYERSGPLEEEILRLVEQEAEGSEEAEEETQLVVLDPEHVRLKPKKQQPRLEGKLYFRVICN